MLRRDRPASCEPLGRQRLGVWDDGSPSATISQSTTIALQGRVEADDCQRQQDRNTFAMP
ncbi:hypothetical protein [Streptomyces sp. NPDC005890]|uniref:hypothetical protein n=1 Tax=Streptomyces sp. NPDC005890 TaxID=3154568 RepID=UPI0033C9F786